MADTTGDLLMSVARRLRHRLMVAMETTGITPHQARALRLVEELEPVRPSVLSERLRIAPRSVTDVVDVLNGAGLVARRPDPDDRRAVQLELTDSGRRQVVELEAIRRQVFERYLSPLVAEDRSELHRILHQLLED